MTFLAITDPGVEPVLQDEVRRYCNTSMIKTENTVVAFETDSVEPFLHRSQSMRRVLRLQATGSVDAILDASYDVDGSFRVTCERVGNHDFNSQDIERELGAVIVDQTSASVDLESPDTVMYCYIYDDTAYVGESLVDADRSKRTYKVYNHPSAPRGNIAYALVHWSSWKSDDTLVDPFCGSALIPIEAALYALDKDPNSLAEPKQSLSLDIHGLDSSSQSLDYGEKNAMAARVDEHVHFSKKPVEWLDVTFEENAVDAIVTQPPMPSKRNGVEAVEEVYDELLYQAAYVVKNDVTVLMRDTSLFTPLVSKHGFSVDMERTVRTGALEYTVLQLTEG